MSTEICSNCEDKIGNLEQAYLFEGKVICQKCNSKLRTEPSKIIDHSKHIAERQPVVQTIEKTSKKWKLLQIISFLMILVGLIAPMTFNPGREPYSSWHLLILLLPVGLILFVIVRILIWWHHG